MLKELGNRDGEEVIGREQTGAFGHDPMPVVVGVASERKIEPVLHPDQPGIA